MSLGVQVNDSSRDATRDSLPRRASFRFSWPSFLLLAVLIYELTSQAWLSITLLCTKFGWEHFRTALWLKRRDPDRARGRIGFWIFAAAGLWRAAMTGFVLMFVYATLTADKNRNQGPPPQFIEATIVAIVGFLTSAGATLFALAIARWHRRTIWLDADMHRPRALELWPPLTTGPNQAGTLILTSMIVVAVPISGLWIGLIVFLAREFGLANEAMAIFFAVAFLLLPISILLVRDYLQGRVLAANANEYWKEGPC
jgi:hypothetical protein